MTQPLAGVRVLDLTRLLPGGVCTMMLADLGADVIKVEDPNGGDYARWMPPLVAGQGVFFRMNNRNKRSIILNLKDERGQDVLRQLAKDADVLVEGFRPEVMGRFGCGYDDLRAINRRLVYCSLSGWGADGPYVARSGHDLNYLSIGGFTGGMPTPQPPGGQVADIGAAYIGVAGILAGLLKAEKSGEGSHVDVALSESALPFVLAAWAEAVSLTLRQPGALTGGLACYNVYGTKDGRYVSLGALEPKFWSNFCTAVGLSEHSDSDYQSPEKQPLLKQTLTDLFAGKTAAEWDALLGDVDCCFALVNDPIDVANDPHIQARGMMGVDDDGTPWMRSPVRMTGEHIERGAIPGYGAHTRDVLAEFGYTPAAIDDLIDAGVVQQG